MKKPCKGCNHLPSLKVKKCMVSLVLATHGWTKEAKPQKKK